MARQSRDGRNRYGRFAKVFLENPKAPLPELCRLADVSEKHTGGYCYEAVTDVIKELVAHGWRPPPIKA